MTNNQLTPQLPFSQQGVNTNTTPLNHIYSGFLNNKPCLPRLYDSYLPMHHYLDWTGHASYMDQAPPPQQMTQLDQVNYKLKRNKAITIKK